MSDAYLKVKDNGAQGLALAREETDTSVGELKTRFGLVQPSANLFDASSVVVADKQYIKTRTVGGAIGLSTANASKVYEHCVYMHKGIPYTFSVENLSDPDQRNYVLCDANGIVLETRRTSYPGTPLTFTFNHDGYLWFDTPRTVNSGAIMISMSNYNGYAAYDGNTYGIKDNEASERVPTYSEFSALKNDVDNADLESLGFVKRRIMGLQTTVNLLDPRKTQVLTGRYINSRTIGSPYGTAVSAAGGNTFATTIKVLKGVSYTFACICSDTTDRHFLLCDENNIVLQSIDYKATSALVFTPNNDGFVVFDIHNSAQDIILSETSLSGEYTEPNNSVVGIANNEASDRTVLQSELKNIFGVRVIDKRANRRLSIGEVGTTVDITNSQYSQLYELSLVPCKGGDIFTISCKASVSIGSYGFVDASGTVLEKNTGTISNKVAVAPEGSAYLIINDSARYNSYIGEKTIASIQSEWFGIPGYYRSHLQSKAEIVRSLAEKSATGDAFVFITDYHEPMNENHSPKLIEWLLNHGDARFVVNGGDNYDDEDTVVKAQNATANFMQLFSPVRDRLYNVLGNHEYNNPSESAEREELELNEKYLYSQLCKYNEAQYASCNSIGAYCIDNANQNVRYFFLAGDKSGNITPANKQWFAETMLQTPVDYQVLVFSHTSVRKTNDTIAPTLSDVLAVLAAARDMTTVTVGGIEYDFTNHHLIPICIMGGHYHRDYIKESENGIYVVSTISDSRRGKYTENGVDVSKDDPNTAGTVLEQSFDVCTLDTANYMLYMTRIGAGSDRSINYYQTT